MEKVDLLFIQNFVFEIEALVEADIEMVIPQYIDDMAQSVKQIVEQELSNYES